jgi:hypothetical protein
MDDETGAITLPPTERRKVHFNRGINIDTIIMLLIMTAGLFVWALGQNDRVTTNTDNIKQNTQDISGLRDRNKEQDLEANRRQDQILTALRDQDQKMDKMLLMQRRH